MSLSTSPIPKEKRAEKKTNRKIGGIVGEKGEEKSTESMAKEVEDRKKRKKLVAWRGPQDGEDGRASRENESWEKPRE